MEKDNIKGCFVSSVLLSQNQWDKKQFIHDFKEDWGIVLTDDDDNGDVLVGMFSGMTLAIAIMPGPVPNGEAEHYAQGNYLWKDATEVARQHEAHILVSVTGDQSNLLERAKLFTRATSSCLKQSYATAVYTDGMVFQPEFYGIWPHSCKKMNCPSWTGYGSASTAHRKESPASIPTD